jgi:hypothetical protein
VVSTTPLNVLLFEVKVVEIHDKRFCFELISSQRSEVVQAESEEDMKEWIKTFENAKQFALSLNGDELKKIQEDLYSPPRPLVNEEKGNEQIFIPDPGSFVFPDQASKRRNAELHGYMRSVPETDYVLTAFSCALVRDFLIQGKIYLTQNRICFYSNIISFITVLVIEIKDILTVEKDEHTLYTNIIINAKDNQVRKQANRYLAVHV